MAGNATPVLDHSGHAAGSCVCDELQRGELGRDAVPAGPSLRRSAPRTRPSRADRERPLAFDLSLLPMAKRLFAGCNSPRRIVHDQAGRMPMRSKQYQEFAGRLPVRHLPATSHSLIGMSVVSFDIDRSVPVPIASRGTATIRNGRCRERAG